MPETDAIDAVRRLVVPLDVQMPNHDALFAVGRPGGDQAGAARLPLSVERLSHETGLLHFGLDLRTESRTVRGLTQTRLERASGVIYRPETERASHYFEVRLADQFDAVIDVDRSHALEPLA